MKAISCPLRLRNQAILGRVVRRNEAFDGEAEERYERRLASLDEAGSPENSDV